MGLVEMIGSYAIIFVKWVLSNQWTLMDPMEMTSSYAIIFVDRVLRNWWALMDPRVLVSSVERIGYYIIIFVV